MSVEDQGKVMYGTDLKAVFHRRVSHLLLDSTSTEASHPTVP